MSKNRYKEEKNSFMQVGIILLIIGMLFIYFGFSSKDDMKKYLKNAVSNDAVITNIEATPSKKDREKYDYTVYITHYVDGEAIDTTLDYYSSGMIIGQHVTVYYKPDNPYNVRSKTSSNISFYVFLGIGIIFLLIGGLIFLYGTEFGRKLFKDNKNKSNSKENRYMARVIESFYDDEAINYGKAPYRVRAEYFDENSIRHEVVSDGSYVDINTLNIEMVPVYVSKFNGVYRVDLNEAIEMHLEK